MLMKPAFDEGSNKTRKVAAAGHLNPIVQTSLESAHSDAIHTYQSVTVNQTIKARRGTRSLIVEVVEDANKLS